MISIKTGYPLIFRFENVIPLEICNEIYHYMISEKGTDKNITIEQMPWHEKDNTGYKEIKDLTIKKYVKTYRDIINNLISESYNQITYPHFSDLVLWRTGRKMSWHRDNGYDWNKNMFEQRVFSCVSYINDDYHGGNTLIKQGNEIYTSVPKKGAVTSFTSDERCEHSVTEITNGTRLTLAMWFTTNINFKEQEDYFEDIKPNETTEDSHLTVVKTRVQ